MNQNKTTKYLKYAFGEIILVVIGILIALSINNWNEERKTRNAEISYIDSIKSDLDGDIETINYIINNTKDRIKAHEYIMEQLKSFDTISDSRPLFKLMRNNVGFTDLKVQDHTIETLKNTGNIEIVHSKLIRTAIQNYYDTVEIIYVQQNVMNNYAINNDLDKIFNYLDNTKGIENNTKVPFDNRSRKNLPNAYEFLSHWISNLEGYIEMLERLETRNTKLVDLINSSYPKFIEND